MAELPKDIEKYGDALIKAWEQYIRIIDFLIALCGATALILVSVMRELGKEALTTELAHWTLGCYGLTLAFITLWRLGAQHFYEYETIGGTDLARRYFEFHGIEQPFTRAFVPQRRLRAFYRSIYPIVAHGSGMLLAATWVLLVLLVFDSPRTHDRPPSSTANAQTTMLGTSRFL